MFFTDSLPLTLVVSCKEFLEYFVKEFEPFETSPGITTGNQMPTGMV